MNTNEYKAKGESLTRDLAQIQQEIITTRAQLETAVSNPAQAEQAGKIAGYLLVLEAREKSTRAAIESNERAAAKHAELLNSKEYKAAQKKIAELEAYFTREADEVFNEMTILRERVQTDMQKHDEYCALLRSYGVEMDRDAKDSKMRGNDYEYLLSIHVMLTQRRKIEQHIETIDRQTAEYTKARNAQKPNPSPVIAQVKQVFHRYQNSDGTPQLDAQGQPVG
jgi:hypothetical protein